MNSGKIHFTEEQERIINLAIDWYRNSSDQIFQYSGNPGTGKTVLMQEIIRRLKIRPDRVAPMAYCGAAAINLRIKGLYNAKTIHSWLYESKDEVMIDENGNEVMDTHFNRPKRHTIFKPKDLTNISLIAIDEGSMVPIHMKDHILGTKKKILVCGDLDQLLPVKDQPAFLYEGQVHVLTQIMRQASWSPIIFLCQRAKQGLPIHTGMYGNDVMVITEDDIIPEMIRWSGVLLCGRNTTRDRLNDLAREQVFGFHGPLPSFGEKVICRKNNWNEERCGINLTNGLTGYVVNHPDPSCIDRNTKSFRIDFLPEMINEPFDNIYLDHQYFVSKSRKEKDDIKAYMSKYRENLFEFGYAQTVHLAQGSQWESGMYFEEYLHPDTNRRLHYTGLSRFKKMCIYVKERPRYFMTSY